MRLGVRGVALATAWIRERFDQTQMISENKTSIYTAGFLNSAVKKSFLFLSATLNFLHWGDTDLEGLETVALLNNIKPMKLYRCGIEECERLKYALKELDPKKRKRAGQMLVSPDFPFRKNWKI